MSINYEVKGEDNLIKQDSGVIRSSDEGKPRFSYLWPKYLPYHEQLQYRFAMHLTKAAAAKGARNWENAHTVEDLERFKEGAYRHFYQWMCGMEDEDHAAALMFAIMGIEYTKYMLEADTDGK